MSDEPCGCGWDGGLRKYCAQHNPCFGTTRGKPVTITAGASEARTYRLGDDWQIERAHELCVELAKGTNGNVPIQSVYEAMLRLIGRQDVIDAQHEDGKGFDGE